MPYFSLTLITSLLLSFTFMRLTHPLALGLTLLAQSILITLSISTISKTTWIAYVLFLIYLGALLVLFIYVASLASNEPFVPLPPLLFFQVLTPLFFLMIFMAFVDPMALLAHNHTSSSTLTYQFSFTTEEPIMSLMLDLYYMRFTLYLILYLFITLIAVVKIASNFLGPLRPEGTSKLSDQLN